MRLGTGADGRLQYSSTTGIDGVDRVNRVKRTRGTSPDAMAHSRTRSAPTKCQWPGMPACATRSSNHQKTKKGTFQQRAQHFLNEDQRYSNLVGLSGPKKLPRQQGIAPNKRAKKTLQNEKQMIQRVHSVVAFACEGAYFRAQAPSASRSIPQCPRSPKKNADPRRAPCPAARRPAVPAQRCSWSSTGRGTTRGAPRRNLRTLG